MSAVLELVDAFSRSSKNFPELSKLSFVLARSKLLALSAFPPQ